MKTICKTVDRHVSFIIVELDPAYHQAAFNLGFTPTDDGLERSFSAAAPHLERIYRNFERYAEEMIMQTAKVHPVPWEQALLAFLSATTNQSIDWWLVGSAALAVRGVDIVPQDLDIATDGAGAQRLGELLLDFLVEPVDNCQDWISDWWGRAFLHARLEWVGDVHENIDQPNVTDFGPVAASRLDIVKWHGKEIRVPPIDLQLQVSEQRGLNERVEKIKDFLSRSETRSESLIFCL